MEVSGGVKLSRHFWDGDHLWTGEGSNLANFFFSEKKLCFIRIASWRDGWMGGLTPRVWIGVFLFLFFFPDGINHVLKKKPPIVPRPRVFFFKLKKKRKKK